MGVLRWCVAVGSFYPVSNFAGSALGGGRCLILGEALSHITHLSISFRRLTPPRNRQLIV